MGGILVLPVGVTHLRLPKSLPRIALISAEEEATQDLKEGRSLDRYYKNRFQPV